MSIFEKGSDGPVNVAAYGLVKVSRCDKCGLMEKDCGCGPVKKANPYHDERGRFTTPEGAARGVGGGMSPVGDIFDLDSPGSKITVNGRPGRIVEFNEADGPTGRDSLVWSPDGGGKPQTIMDVGEKLDSIEIESADSSHKPEKPKAPSKPSTPDKPKAPEKPSAEGFSAEKIKAERNRMLDQIDSAYPTLYRMDNSRAAMSSLKAIDDALDSGDAGLVGSKINSALEKLDALAESLGMSPSTADQVSKIEDMIDFWESMKGKLGG